MTRLTQRIASILPPVIRQPIRRTRAAVNLKVQRSIVTPRNLKANAGRKGRRLEIGPGERRVPGFETLNIVPGPDVDYVTDAAGCLPFEDDTFDVVFASHILEHIPWHRSAETLREWVRILAPGGTLEIWVPDGELICEAILAHSRGEPNAAHEDGWRRLNPEGDPFLWANGRLFYGANPAYPSWHTAVFTAESLRRLFCRAGLSDVRRVDESLYRGGANMGPINLGVFGTKP